MSSSEKEELSFSEWCDRTFTNMYSHSDFVMSPSRASGREFTRPKGKVQTAQVHQDKQNTVFYQGKDASKSTSPNFSGTEFMVTIPSEDCLQANRSSSFERWPKYSGEGLKSDPRIFSEVKNWDKKRSSVRKDTRTVVTTVADDVHHDESRRPPRNPEVEVIKNDHPRSDTPRTSVGSVHLEENLTTKRCHSELSPCRKHAKSSKTKKRLRSSDSNPKKCVEPLGLSITESHRDLKQCVTDGPVCDDNNQNISGANCGLESFELKNSNSRSIHVERDVTKSVLKKNVESLKTSEHDAMKKKHRHIGEACNVLEVYSADHTGSVVSAEFEVDLASSEGEKYGVCLPLSVKGKQWSRKNKALTCRRNASGKDAKQMTQEVVVQSVSCPSSSKNQHGNCNKLMEKLEDPNYVSPKMHDEYSWKKVCHKKKSKTRQAGSHKSQCEQPKRNTCMCFGEYDLESSLEGEDTKQESFESVCSKKVVNEILQRGRKDGNINEVDQKLTKVNISEHDCDLSSKSRKTKEYKLEKAPTLKKMKSTKSKSSERRDNGKMKEVDGVKRHTEANEHKEPSASSSRFQVEKIITSPKSSMVKNNVQEKESITRNKSRSLSPTLQTEVGSVLFTRRVLESVVKPLATSSKSATSHSRPKSAEMVKASKRIGRSSQMQRKLSWPSTKVHVRLEHIYQAFDSAGSSSSDDDFQARLMDSKESGDKKAESTGRFSEEAGGITCKPFQWCQQTKELLPEEMPPLYYKTPTCTSSKHPKMQLEGDTSEVQRPGCFVIPPKTISASKSLNPEAKRFIPKFIPRSTSEEKISAVEEICTVPDKQVHVPPGHMSPQTKKDYVFEWLKKQDKLKELMPSSSNPVSSVEGTRKERQSSETVEPSDSSESWECVIDNIMRIEHEDIFCKRVEQIRRNTSPRSVSPFRMASNRVDLTNKAFLAKKNVATVSPFCVYPPIVQLKAIPSSWSEPLPSSLDLNCSWDTCTSSFIPVTDKSLDDTDAENTRGSISSTPTMNKNQTRNSGFSTCSPSLLTSNRKPVVDLAPRFRRRAQLEAQSRAASDLVTFDNSTGPRSVFSEGISQLPKLTSSPQTGIDCKQEFRPWVSGSLGWSTSVLCRTPGTITPTRFTPWTSEISTPNSWKGSRSHQSLSIELSSMVNYPVSSIPYIDTHCHIDFLFQRLEYRGTYKNFVRTHNFPDNYSGCLAVFCTTEGFERGALWEDLVVEKNIWVAFGCHPHHAKSYDGVVEENVIRCMRHPKAIALGEIGLDYSNRCSSDRPLQLQVFRRQLQIALHLQKPLVIHSRDAEQDTLNIMKEMVPRTYKIHRHCFTGSPQEARNFFRAFPNSFIGLTALVTFPTAYPVHRTATEIPLDRILLETDAPYFLPKQCPRMMRWADPSMAVFVAARIAQLRRLPLDEVLLTIRQNTTRMYGI